MNRSRKFFPWKQDLEVFFLIPKLRRRGRQVKTVCSRRVVVFVGRKQQVGRSCKRHQSGREEGRPATKPNRCVQNSWHLLVSCPPQGALLKGPNLFAKSIRIAQRGAASLPSAEHLFPLLESDRTLGSLCQGSGPTDDILGFAVGTDDSSAHTIRRHHGHHGW